MSCWKCFATWRDEGRYPHYRPVSAALERPPTVARLYLPDEFRLLKEESLKMGFRHVESGPLVRSSYHAHEQADAGTRVV